MSEKYEKITFNCDIENCQCVDECPICFETINLHKKYLSCKICTYNFHKKCIKKWERRIQSIKNQCVVCQSSKSLKKFNPDIKPYRSFLCFC